MASKKLSRAKIRAAIPNSGGIVAIVAKAAGYSWGATRDFIRNDPELSAMMQDEAETINDMAEVTVVTKIKGGDENTARWWLARTRRAKFGDAVDLTTKGESLNDKRDEILRKLDSIASARD